MLVLFHIILEIPLLSFTHSAHAHRMCPFRMTQRAPCALFLNAPLPLLQAAGNPIPLGIITVYEPPHEITYVAKVNLPVVYKYLMKKTLQLLINQ